MAPKTPFSLSFYCIIYIKSPQTSKHISLPDSRLIQQQQQFLFHHSNSLGSWHFQFRHEEWMPGTAQFHCCHDARWLDSRSHFGMALKIHLSTACHQTNRCNKSHIFVGFLCPCLRASKSSSTSFVVEPTFLEPSALLFLAFRLKNLVFKSTNWSCAYNFSFFNFLSTFHFQEL